ncbi:phage tail protein [Sphingobium sp. DEHP117]|uniref:phage tail protein n=1 Tax=Sphingobium sp. DEHP117 TaxID=2993436 RepID=UPI0027D58B62|nr:phage tail protein [Sphingobium sp. DEHP117]MDQ4420535.1 phage tail protein [Sphingobium sp. DEHP117]
MATVVLTVVGSVLGGPLGATIGAAIGQAIDQNVLFKPKGRVGPRLNDLRIQTSRYGDQIPKIFGSMRVAGTVIWATDLIEQRHTSGGGKGKPKTTTYTYSASFAVAISARRIAGIDRIWADGNLLRGAAGDFKTYISSFRVYPGSEDQAADYQIAGAVGLANASAHRGMAYVVFQDLVLTDFGNRIPSLTFEVIAENGAVPVADIANDLSDGLIAPDGGGGPFVMGYAASGSGIADALLPLVEGYSLALRTGAAGTGIIPAGPIEANIPADMIGARFNGRREKGAKLMRGRAEDAPLRVSMRHYDPGRDHQAGVQMAERAGPGRREEALDLPASLDAVSARALAEARLHSLWTGRRTLELRCDWRALGLEPGAVVTVDSENGRWRIERSEWEGMGVRLSLRQVGGAGVAAPPADGGAPVLQADQLHGPTSLVIADLPMPDDTLLTAPLVAVAAAGAQAGWRAAELFVEDAASAALISIGGTALPAIIGTTAGALGGAASAALFDLGSTLDVQLLNSAMQLANADDAALLRGANLALVGNEVIQFGLANQTGPTSWRLSRLLRGRRGTEWAMAGHSAGEPILLLDQASLLPVPTAYAVMGSTLLVDAIGIGDTAPVKASVAVAGQAVLPLSPVHGTAVAVGGGWQLGWVRRSRIGWQWVDGADAPLGEEQEQYRIDLVKSGGVYRSVTTSSPQWTYDAAMIAVDHGLGISGPVTAQVRQIGTFGAGRPASIALSI